MEPTSDIAVTLRSEAASPAYGSGHAHTAGANAAGRPDEPQTLGRAPVPAAPPITGIDTPTAAEREVGVVNESDAEEASEDDNGSARGRPGLEAALPALIPAYALPRSWSGAFADQLTENVYQIEAHCVQYPALLLVVAILILFRIGA